MSFRSIVMLAVSLVVRPRLWGDALAAVVRLARRDWWRRWPPVPSPDPDYLAWRAQTANGDDERSAAAVAEDVVSYLTFCRGLRLSRRH